MIVVTETSHIRVDFGVISRFELVLRDESTRYSLLKFNPWYVCIYMHIRSMSCLEMLPLLLLLLMLLVVVDRQSKISGNLCLFLLSSLSHFVSYAVVDFQLCVFVFGEIRIGAHAYYVCVEKKDNCLCNIKIQYRNVLLFVICTSCCVFLNCMSVSVTNCIKIHVHSKQKQSSVKYTHEHVWIYIYIYI